MVDGLVEYLGVHLEIKITTVYNIKENIIIVESISILIRLRGRTNKRDSCVCWASNAAWFT